MNHGDDEVTSNSQPSMVSSWWLWTRIRVDTTALLGGADGANHDSRLKNLENWGPRENNSSRGV